MDRNSGNHPNNRGSARPHEFRAQRPTQGGTRRCPERARSPRARYGTDARSPRAAGHTAAAPRGSKRKLAFALVALVAVPAVAVVLRAAVAAPGQGSDDAASTSAQVFAQGGFDRRDSRASDGDVTAVKTSAGALSTTRSEADRSATRRATTSPSQSSWPTSRRRPRVTTAAACSCTTSSPSRPRSRLCRRSFSTSSTRATPSTCSPRQAAATTSRKGGAAPRRACV